MTPETDDEVARRVARAAGDLLLRVRAAYAGADLGDREVARDLRREGDRAAHELIAAALASARPRDALLSEEGVDDPRRLRSDRVWIVDPLDGTWEFGQDRPDFAVHIALWHRDAGPDGGLVAGCVDLPAQGLTRSCLDEVTGDPALPADRPVRVVVSRTRPPESLSFWVGALGEQLAADGVADLGVEVVRVGSVGAKVNELLSGRAEVYVHDTGFHEWDVAAPYVVARHHRFAASRIDGSEVTFNHRPPYVTDLLVAHPAVLPAVRAVIDRVGPP